MKRIKIYWVIQDILARQCTGEGFNTRHEATKEILKFIQNNYRRRVHKKPISITVCKPLGKSVPQFIRELSEKMDKEIRKGKVSIKMPRQHGKASMGGYLIGTKLMKAIKKGGGKSGLKRR